MSASDRYNRVENPLTVDMLAEHITAWQKAGLGPAKVLAWDPESEQNETVTGFILSLEEMVVIIQTDEP